MPELSLIKSVSHPLVKQLVAIRTEAKSRKEHQLALIASDKVIHDLGFKRTFKTLVVKEGGQVPTHLRYENLYTVSKEAFKKITGLLCPGFLAATVDLKQMPSFDPSGFVLVLDGLQDPGNVGMLIRSALAFGIRNLFFLPGTVDIMNDKVLRAARAGAFEMGFKEGSIKELFALAKKHNAQLVAADLKGSPPESIKPGKAPLYLVLGSEGSGLTSEIKKAATTITLSISEATESLNVAAAGSILLYLLTQGEAR